MKKSIKLTILTLLILTLGTAISACVKKPVIPVETGIQKTATATTEIDTSDWKTYRTEEYGFEFKYPGEWVSNILKDGRLSFYPKDKKIGYDYIGDILIKIYKNSSKKIIPEYYRELDFNIFDEKNYKEEIIGDYRIFHFIDFPGLVLSDIYVLELEDLIIEVNVYNNQNIISEEIIKSIRKTI